MLKLKNKTAALLEEAVKASFGDGLLSAEEINSMLEYPPDSSMGDLALPCFKLSKTLRRSPVQIADTLAAAVRCEEFSSVSAVNGYLNFKINKGDFVRSTLEKIFDEKEQNFGVKFGGFRKMF